ncbi:hypothetical protein [Geobacter sp. AOG1]|uniref:hypothetical protein n=1 Tax=Geobacter sp. AOG1 TaxID=1566346 RepID=UPI001CC4AC6A|nr:hypothetical protein [Geobacter sp. AOG1]GFE56626.1 hypothetical protein AOG1_05050 [Geobacter sp. AOG1]
MGHVSHILGPAVMVLAVLAGTVAAEEDVRGVKLRQQELKVIEEKCLVCHNRQRIDAAAAEKRDMDRILRRMEQKGVVLTEQERQVMGHFKGQQVFRPPAGGDKPVVK